MAQNEPAMDAAGAEGADATERDRGVVALRAAIEGHGGHLVAVDVGAFAHVEVGGVTGRVYLDILRRRVAAGEPMEQAAARFARALAAPRVSPGDTNAQRAWLRLGVPTFFPTESPPKCCGTLKPMPVSTKDPAHE